MAETAHDRFAALLAEHLAKGTRPATAKGEPWTNAAFAAEVPSSREDGDYASPRSVANWRKGKSLPTEIAPILRALFGPVGSSDRHAEAREALRDAFVAARSELIERAEPDSAGATWVVKNDRIAIDRSNQPADLQAAADPLQQQLRSAICDMAAALIEPAKRLSNALAWGRLSATTAAFHAAVAVDPLEMPSRIGLAYAYLLQLGQFLDTDIRIQRDPSALDDPLPADIHALLISLVRMAAPWLRRFPTVANWDDEAGKALVRSDLFQPAREFIRIARAKDTISHTDAAEMEVLGDPSDPAGYQGQKAGTRAVGSAVNLMLMAAALLSESDGSDLARSSLVAQRAGATLGAAKDQVAALASTRPPDLRHALQALAAELRETGTSGMKRVPAAPRSPVPDDAEDRARDMILAGIAPPPTWRASIQALNFADTPLTDLSPLESLTALKRLFLQSTKVIDLAPLAGLTELQLLDLRDTQVSDLMPLAGLTALQILSLIGTEAKTLAPLGGLVALQVLDLTRTSVHDLAPISTLNALQRLYLQGTPVSDLTPLAGLTALHRLDLLGTQVRDLTPLAGLVALQTLSLKRTPISDLAPLAGLTAMQALDLSATEVSDLTPIAGLTALHHVDLKGTPVSSLAPLANLTALQHLDLRNTQVSDLDALAGLAALKTLDLQGTQVTDLGPLTGLTALESLDLRVTGATNLDPLVNLTGLQDLYLTGRDASDVSALGHIAKLKIHRSEA